MLCLQWWPIIKREKQWRLKYYLTELFLKKNVFDYEKFIFDEEKN